MIVLPTFTGQGASGIIAGLMGYSVYASYKYFRDVQQIKFNVNFLWLIFLINAICLWYYLPRVVNQLIFWVIFAIITSLILVLFYSQITGIKQIITKLQRNINNLNLDLNVSDLNSVKTALNSSVIFIYWVILFSLLIVVYGGLITLVPSNPWQAGALTNTVVHYLGFSFGLLAPIIYDFFATRLNFKI
jgi:glucan phosphoethanolaminetransferase (alkaline phosphatase superfamily)